MYFPNLLELSFRTVLALPKAEYNRIIIKDIRPESELPTLQDRIGVQDLLLYPGVLAAAGRQVLQDQLGALRLPCPGLSADDYALVLSVSPSYYSSQIPES